MRRTTFLKTSLYLTFLLLAMLYGIVAARFGLPPYQVLNDIYSSFVSKEYIEIPEVRNETPNLYTETDVVSLISIKQPQDVYRLRSELSNFLWGSPKPPLTFPATININKSFTDERYQDIASLRNIEKIVVNMEFGLESHIYHFMPKEPNNKVVLYHQGHWGGFYLGKKPIKKLLDNGYSVVAFSMPLTGLNNQPIIQVPGIGNVKLLKHRHMRFLSPERGHPIKYFIEPVLIVLNYLEDNYGYSSVSMLGISGGGWTTTLVAALDARVEKSFSVAGSYPIFLRIDIDWGDYEQNYPALYQNVNYLELYVLAAYGTGRRHLQIINKYDPCCFTGTRWEAYKDIIKTLVHKLGEGEYDLFLDDSHKEHLISPVAMKQVLNELDSSP